MNIADLLSYSLSSRHEVQRRLGFLAQVHTTLFNYLHYRLLHPCITCIVFRTTHKNVIQIIKRPQRKQDPPISSGSIAYVIHIQRRLWKIWNYDVWRIPRSVNVNKVL